MLKNNWSCWEKMKHFLETLEREINFQKEFNKIEEMVVNEAMASRYSGSFTLNSLIENNFRKWKKRKNYTSFREVREVLGFALHPNAFGKYDFAAQIDMEKYFLYCEMLVNLVMNTCNLEDELVAGKIDEILFTIEAVLEKTGFELKRVNGEIIVAEKNAVAIETADLVPELSDVIIEYNHYLLKGDLDRKKEILRRIADSLEPKRREYESICKKEISDFFFMVNNFNLRHNNCDPSDKNKYFEPFAKLPESEQEKWYDTVYEQALAIVVLVDQRKRENQIKTMKAIGK